LSNDAVDPDSTRPTRSLQADVEGETSTALETVLSDFENLAAPAFERVCAAPDRLPGDEDRATILTFMAFQFWRGRRFRHHYNAMPEYLMKMMLSMDTRDRDMIRQLLQSDETDSRDGVARPGGEFEGFRDKTSGDVRVDPEVQQNSSRDDALKLGKHLRRHDSGCADAGACSSSRRERRSGRQPDSPSPAAHGPQA
jgi:hypothetical protein